MTFRFRFNPATRAAQIAEDMGYDHNWLGIENSNPFPIGTINHQRYEWGWNEAQRDLDEWADAYYPSNEYGDELLH